MILSKRLKLLSAMGLLSLGATTVQAQAQPQQNPTQQNPAQQNPAQLQQQNPAQQNPALQGRGGNQVQEGFNGGFQQTPWFANPQIRKQLQLNDEQFNRLNQSYMQAWQQYNQGINGLDKQLTNEQRMQRMQELNQGLYKRYSTDIDETIADRAARRRFNQMDWQYRGYAAFNDPTIQQQLNLNQEQLLKLQQYQNEWNNQLGIWRKEYSNDREGVAKSFQEARKEVQDRIKSILSPEQRKIWADMVGKPFDFTPDVYFQEESLNDKSPKPRSK